MPGRGSLSPGKESGNSGCCCLECCLPTWGCSGNEEGREIPCLPEQAAGIKGKRSDPELPNSQEEPLPALCPSATAGTSASSKPPCSPARKHQWDRQEHTASSQALQCAMPGSGKPLGCRMEKGAWCRQEALNWREQPWHEGRQRCHTRVPKRSWEPAAPGAV